MSDADMRDAGAGAAAMGEAARWNGALAVWRLVGVVVWTLLCFAVFIVYRSLLRTDAKRQACTARGTQYWFRRLMRITGIAFEVRGDAVGTAGLLTPNHVTYLDIIALGAVVPTVFVSKADVEQWPVIGALFRFSDHIGITRADRRHVGVVNDRVAGCLRNDVRVAVFLEGTTTAGDRLLPFHASLVQPALDAEAPIVPVAVRWHADAPGVTVTDDIAYWRDDHVFGPHLWRVLGLRGLRVELIFGEPIATCGRDRRELADEARSHIAQLLEFPEDR